MFNCFNVFELLTEKHKWWLDKRDIATNSTLLNSHNDHNRTNKVQLMGDCHESFNKLSRNDSAFFSPTFCHHERIKVLLKTFILVVISFNRGLLEWKK